MEICKICRKEFKSLKSLAQHLAKPEIKQNHNISGTKNYYDMFIKSSNEGICKLDGCNNSTGYIGLKLGYLKYCCHKHGQISKEIKTLRSENNKKSWKDPISGHNSIECRLKMSESKRQNWKDENS